MAPAYDEWCYNDPIHLQQRVFKEIGAGTWSGIDKAVPVTERGEKFESFCYNVVAPLGLEPHGREHSSFSRQLREDRSETNKGLQPTVVGHSRPSIELAQIEDRQHLMGAREEHSGWNFI